MFVLMEANGTDVAVVMTIRECEKSAEASRPVTSIQFCFALVQGQSALYFSGACT